jgi:hypothetical protein
MLLLAPARVADGLRNGTLSERSRFHLLLFGIVLGTLFSRRPVTSVHTNGDLLLTALFLTVSLLGLYNCYSVNGGANGRGFIERYVCLAAPVAIRVYGAYYVLYYAAFLLLRPGVVAAPHALVASRWLPAVTALIAMLAYYWILRGYIRRSAGLAG